MCGLVRDLTRFDAIKFFARGGGKLNRGGEFHINFVDDHGGGGSDGNGNWNGRNGNVRNNNQNGHNHYEHYNHEMDYTRHQMVIIHMVGI